MRLASIRTLALCALLTLAAFATGCATTGGGRVPTVPRPISILMPPGAPPAGPTAEEE